MVPPSPRFRLLPRVLIATLVLAAAVLGVLGVLAHRTSKYEVRAEPTSAAHRASEHERGAEPASAAGRFLESIPRARADAARAEADRILRGRPVEADGYVVPFARHPWLAAARTPEEARLALADHSILVARHLDPLPPQMRHSAGDTGDPASPHAIDGLEANHHYSIRAEVVRVLSEADRGSRAPAVPETVRWDDFCVDHEASCNAVRAAIRDRSAEYLVVLQRSEGFWFLSTEVEEPLRLEPGSRAEAIARLASRRGELAATARSRQTGAKARIA